MRAESSAYSLKHGYAPSASKVVCVDFDGTLYPFAEIFEGIPPFDGAAEAVRSLKESGYRIVIYTSRLSRAWLASESHNAIDHIDYIRMVLDRDAIPYDDITGEKIPAEYYIDDRAIEFKENWLDIRDRIIGGGA